MWHRVDLASVAEAGLKERGTISDFVDKSMYRNEVVDF